jgi:hypothetical protein
VARDAVERISEGRARRGPPLVLLPAVWVGAAVGAALAYFFDPDRGRGRRAQTRDRFTAYLRRTGEGAGRRARWSQGPIAGLGARIAGAFSTPEPMNDATLAAKVESELFRDPKVPKGRININAEQGTVVLRGVVDSPDQIEHLLAQTASIEGVREARSLLRTADEPVEAPLERPRKTPVRAAGATGSESG